MMRHVLFLRAVAAALMRSTYQRREPQRIAIYQSMKMGDMVCTTPLFAALKRALPRAHIIVLGDAVNEALLRGHPHVDEYVLLADLTEERLAELTIDVLIFPGPNPIGLARALIARIPRIIAPRVTGGRCPQQTLWYRLLLLFAERREHRFGAYAPREYLRLLEPLGIYTSDTTKLLALESAKDAAARERRTGRALVIGIAPSAGNKIKQWPARNFAAVADALSAEYGADIVLVGGPHDRAEAEEMLAHMQHAASVRNTVGTLSIEELKACIKNLDLFIASDTGPIYIAEAFGVPTVDIVGPVDECEQPPTGERHLVVLPTPRRGPYLHVMNARIYDPSLVTAEVMRTSVAAVLRAAHAILSKV